MPYEKYVIMKQEEMEKTVTRLSAEIVEKIKDIENAVIIGVKTRGVPLGRKIRDEIKRLYGRDIPFGAIDITFYRDDLSLVNESPVVKATDLPFNINDKVVILTDDVLYTGRTVRAALDELMDFGRPRIVKLLVLIDRGHRELPVCPDFVGKTITTTDIEIVKVKFLETDGKEEVVMAEKES